jgi:hypothetical protein
MTDLAAKWTVLETEASGTSPESIRTVPTGTTVTAGPVNAGVDGLGHRHLIIPLLPGEAFAEDRTGRGVQLWRVTLDGDVAASLVCLLPAFNDIFERLALDVLREASEATSPARKAADVLAAWKELLAAAEGSAVLSDERLVGLLGELLCLELVAALDPMRRVDTWSGPSGHQHDLVYSDHAVEVKSTTVKEGRVVTINSVDQLDPSPARSLHLVFQRFQAAPLGTGETLPSVIKRLAELGLSPTALHKSLTLLGYSPAHDENYRRRPFLLVERRVYDSTRSSFPKIVRSSFVGAVLPAGTLRLAYAIDLTGEPPSPLSDVEVSALWQTLAQSGA